MTSSQYNLRAFAVASVCTGLAVIFLLVGVGPFTSPKGLQVMVLVLGLVGLALLAIGVPFRLPVLAGMGSCLVLLGGVAYGLIHLFQQAAG